MAAIEVSHLTKRFGEGVGSFADYQVEKCNPGGAPNVQPHHVLRPIPQTQIDRTEGGATAFPQNPGY